MVSQGVEGLSVFGTVCLPGDLTRKLPRSPAAGCWAAPWPDGRCEAHRGGPRYPCFPWPSEMLPLSPREHPPFSLLSHPFVPPFSAHGSGEIFEHQALSQALVRQQLQRDRPCPQGKATLVATGAERRLCRTRGGALAKIETDSHPTIPECLP